MIAISKYRLASMILGSSVSWALLTLSSDDGVVSLSSGTSYAFLLLNSVPLLFTAILEWVLNTLAIPEDVAAPIFAISFLVAVPLWWFALGHLFYRRLHDPSGQNKWHASREKKGFRLLPRTVVFAYLAYPIILFLLLAMMFLPAAVSVGHEYPPGTVTYFAAHAFQAYQWLVLPVRIVHENPHWMRPGTTIHYSYTDFVHAGAVSIGIWTTVFLLIIVPLRYFLFRTGSAQQSPAESDSAVQVKGLES